MSSRRVGIWLIGAFGGVGSSVALGLAALRRGLTATTGLVTALPDFAALDLDPPADFVVGGHDLRADTFGDAARAVGGRQPAYPERLIETCRRELDEWTANVRPGMAAVPGAIDRIRGDLTAFRTAHKLDQVAVVNLASTEPPFEPDERHETLTALRSKLGDAGVLPPSAAYAYAAIDVGMAYVNFTPSRGADLPALLQLAGERGAPVAGQDGKTGETLVKTALAPLFARRNLKLLSWVGHNILGNRDGLTLSDPRHKLSKVRSKDQVVEKIVGYPVQTLTSIEYVESLDDWKTAWDHVHFEGFLGVRMALQFTWQGCDSALAAPLVIDLARLTLLAQRRGESGVLPQVACFFKSPMGGGGHDFFDQCRRLDDYILGASGP